MKSKKNINNNHLVHSGPVWKNPQQHASTFKLSTFVSVWLRSVRLFLGPVSTKCHDLYLSLVLAPLLCLLSRRTITIIIHKIHLNMFFLVCRSRNILSDSVHPMTWHQHRICSYTLYHFPWATHLIHVASPTRRSHHPDWQWQCICFVSVRIYMIMNKRELEDKINLHKIFNYLRARGNKEKCEAKGKHIVHCVRVSDEMRCIQHLRNRCDSVDDDECERYNKTAEYAFIACAGMMSGVVYFMVGFAMRQHHFWNQFRIFCIFISIFAVRHLTRDNNANDSFGVRGKNAMSAWWLHAFDKEDFVVVPHLIFDLMRRIIAIIAYHNY